LADFVEKALLRGDMDAVEAVLRGFDELAEWARNAGRSGITLRRLIVAPDGGKNSVHLILTAFSANDQTELIRETLRAAAAGEPAYGLRAETSPAEKTHRVAAGHPAKDHEPASEGDIKCVRDGGGWMYVDRRGHHVIDRVWTAAAPFREGRAEVETLSGRGLIDTLGRTVIEPVYEEVTWDEYWNLVAVMSEGRWSLLDRDGILLTDEVYDWLGECSEGLVLASRDGKCGFLDVEGRLAIPLAYDDASSFCEGLALVSADGHSFFIDSTGARVI
jgi:hypothetical protein